MVKFFYKTTLVSDKKCSLSRVGHNSSNLRIVVLADRWFSGTLLYK